MKPRDYYWRWRGLLFAVLLLPGAYLWAQAKSESPNPPPIPPQEGRRLAKELVSRLLKLKPQESTTQELLVKVRDRDDVRNEIPARFSLIPTGTNVLSIYETLGPPDGGMKLTIGQSENQPNEYWLSRPANAPARRLTAAEALIPFAGSDFWAVDLGLDFLRWPQQRVTKKEMRKSLFCDVLESINPQPFPGGYSKVVSWIAANHPDDVVIVHADAYDAQGKLLKWFDPKKVEKVDGAWELAEMELINRQAGSRTRIQFVQEH